MTVILWILGILLSINLIFRLFGRQISAWLMKRVLKQLANSAQAERIRYERNYGQGDLRDNVYVDREVKVTAPKHQPKPSVSAEEIAEEIEYEELR